MMIHAGIADCVIRATLSVGGFRNAMVPFSVFLMVELNSASGVNARIVPIARFFKLIGRARGATEPSASDTSVSSSDIKRQPRLINAAHNVLLPAPEGPGKM